MNPSDEPTLDAIPQAEQQAVLATISKVDPSQIVTEQDTEAAQAMSDISSGKPVGMEEYKEILTNAQPADSKTVEEYEMTITIKVPKYIASPDKYDIVLLAAEQAFPCAVKIIKNSRFLFNLSKAMFIMFVVTWFEGPCKVGKGFGKRASSGLSSAKALTANGLASAKNMASSGLASASSGLSSAKSMASSGLSSFKNSAASGLSTLKNSAATGLATTAKKWSIFGGRRSSKHKTRKNGKHKKHRKHKA
jgi:hypothetical protein